MSKNNEYYGKHLEPEKTHEPIKKAAKISLKKLKEKPITGSMIEKKTIKAPSETEQAKGEHTKKKKSVGVKVGLGILAVLMLLFVGSVGFISAKFGKMNFEDARGSVEDNVSTNSSELDEAYEEKRSSKKEKNVYNVLLIGVDNDYLPGMSERGNSDGIMLLSVNTKTEQVVLTSIMRDVWIHIPEQYSTKVTLVYHDFGTETLISMIEHSFDIVVDNYALVNYFNIIEIIDALGGLDLDISANETNLVNDKMDNINYLTGDPDGTDYLTADDVGLTHLNGKQVTAWLRIRMDGGNDQKRTERARQVILAAKDKVSEMGLLELNSFSDVVLKNITTDVSTTQALSLLAQVPAYLKYEFVSNRIPLEGSYTSDESYIYIDYDENTKALHEAVYGDVE